MSILDPSHRVWIPAVICAGMRQSLPSNFAMELRTGISGVGVLEICTPAKVICKGCCPA